MEKEPRAVKTKEEILAEIKANGDFQKKMAFTRGQFFPALCKASTSIEDAQTLLAGFNTQIMQEFLGLMKEKKMGDLNLQLKLDVGGDKYLEFQAMLDLFKDMSVFEAKDCIEGMRAEIQLWLQDEQRARPLAEITTKWIDEL